MIFQPIQSVGDYDNETRPRNLRDFWRLWFRLFRLIRKEIDRNPWGSTLLTQTVKSLWPPQSIEGYWYRRMMATEFDKCTGVVPPHIRLTIRKLARDRRVNPTST